MTKIAITADDLQIDLSQLADFSEVSAKAMSETLIRHKQALDKGQGPDGASLGGYAGDTEIGHGHKLFGRSLKPGWPEEKLKDGTRVVKRFAKPIRLQLSGDLMDTRQVTAVKQAGVGGSSGADAKFMGGHYSGHTPGGLASILADRGFSFHFLGDVDRESIYKRVTAEIEKQFKKAVTVIKKN